MNSNPCQPVVTHDNATHARCICGGKWAGPRCEHLIRLKPESVTSSQAKLKVELMTPQKADVMMTSRGSSALSLVSSEEEKEVTLTYTLVYWRRNDTITSLTADASLLTSGEISCVLLHQKKSRQPTLEGLLPRTRYTICVENGDVDSCVLSSFTDFSSSPSLPAQPRFASSRRSGLMSSWPSNCVTIFTPSEPLPPSVITKSSTVTAVAVVSVLILAVLIIVFVLFLVRRQSVTVRVFIDGVLFRRCCCSCRWCQSESSCNNSLDRTRLSQSSSFSQASRTAVWDPDGCPREKRSLKRAVLERLRPSKKRQKSSSYATANALLPPPPPPSGAFSGTESSPLDVGLDVDGLNDDAVFENSPERPATAPVLPAIHRGRSKPRHRLSRKRRGYVAYSTKKDKNIRLTTVLETAVDDEACDAGLMDEVEPPFTDLAD